MQETVCTKREAPYLLGDGHTRGQIAVSKYTNRTPGSYLYGNSSKGRFSSCAHQDHEEHRRAKENLHRLPHQRQVVRKLAMQPKLQRLPCTRSQSERVELLLLQAYTVWSRPIHGNTKHTQHTTTTKKTTTIVEHKALIRALPRKAL